MALVFKEGDEEALRAIVERLRGGYRGILRMLRMLNGMIDNANSERCGI